jgi:serine/threonine protein kinase
LIPIDPTRIQTALSGYQVGGELGRGAYGLVLAGRHLRLNRPVAIKVLDPGGDGDGLARFAAEAQVLASLDHPHVVRVHDYVEADGLCLIVMERLAGGDAAGLGWHVRPA